MVRLQCLQKQRSCRGDRAPGLVCWLANGLGRANLNPHHRAKMHGIPFYILKRRREPTGRHRARFAFPPRMVGIRSGTQMYAPGPKSNVMAHAYMEVVKVEGPIPDNAHYGEQVLRVLWDHKHPNNLGRFIVENIFAAYSLLYDLGLAPTQSVPLVWY